MICPLYKQSIHELFGNSQDVTNLFGFQEYFIRKTNGKDADFPAAETYNKLLPHEIEAICKTKLPKRPLLEFDFEPWEKQHPGFRYLHRLKAYWTIRGAPNPFGAAIWHALPPANPEWGARLIDGLTYPNNLHEMEQIFLTKPTPSARLILERCPQMAMIHALRGDVSEPYWWAMLSVTEHATPNLSKECSDGYPGFTDKELAYRVRRIHKDEIKPALCERLDSVNRGTCDLCRFKGVIRSPIALGYENEPKNRNGVGR